MNIIRTSALLLAAAALLPGLSAQQPPLRVFLLAGQSNMEGQAVVDLDHEQHYNGGRGTLAHLLADPAKAKRWPHLRDGDGAWTVRDDVFVRYLARGEKLKKGPLSVGFAVYDGRHHFGPELQLGHVLGERFDEPVLLVKTAWGGKSLFRDFRPPGAGGEVGPFYDKMIADYRAAVAAIPADFPKLAGHRPVLSGFFWFQGWNDMVDKRGRESYADNLALLIRAVRKDLSAPKLPVVVAETGNAESDGFSRAQAAGVNRREFRGNATFVKTRAFLRRPEDSPNVTHGHHWYGNAESYLLIGDAMGRAMLKLLD